MKRILTVVTLIAVVFGSTGCSTTPRSESDKKALSRDVRSSITYFKKRNPGYAPLFESSYGYAVLPNVGKGAVGIGAAYGRGEVYEQGKLVGYCDMSQGSIGLQLGGQTYGEIIFFETKTALDHFKASEFDFAAQASAVALKSGATETAKFINGILVFTINESGLMYEASIGGQRFDYDPL